MTNNSSFDEHLTNKASETYSNFWQKLQKQQTKNNNKT